MKPLYTQEEFNKSRYGDKLPVECYVCEKTFYKLKRVIQRALKSEYGCSGKFCSQKCAGEHKKKLIEVKKCKKCGISHTKDGLFCSHKCANIFNGRPKTKEEKLKISKGVKESPKFIKGISSKTYKLRKRGKRGRNKTFNKKPIILINWHCPVCDKMRILSEKEAKGKKYCSGKCRNQVNNKFQTGTRSYAEKYLEQKLIECFPNLDIIFNSRQILKNNRELDVYIPSLKFALEWNGIYHYKKIKKEKLDNIKKKDLQKKIECKIQGISLYVVKDLTSNKKFIKEETEKIVCIIHGLIHWRDSRTPNPMPE